MRLAWGMLALGVACYRAPTAEQACSITCTDTCPGGLSCEGGYCVAPGEVCHPSFSQLTAGTGFACAIDDTTRLWCWGSNRHNQIDPGTRKSYSLATRLAGEPGWTTIDAGGEQICGIRDDRLLCWGQNDHGEVAVGTPGDVTAPTEIAFTDSPAKWTQVSAGDGYTCAIGDGKLYCWGRGLNGILGNDSTDDVDRPPTQVGTATDWLAVATGSSHTCGIAQSLGLMCWGNDAHGELGPSATVGTNTGTPVPVALPGTPTSVAVTVGSSCATLDSGAVYCWGDNTYGQLGDPKVLPTPLSGSIDPKLASDKPGWSALGAGEAMMCGLAGDAVECWGTAYGGGIGEGAWTDARFGQVATGAGAIAVGWNKDVSPVDNFDYGDEDLACYLGGGDIHCWGDNRYGQLGTGGATLALEPTEVAGHHSWSTIELGADHGCGLDGGALYCWGSTVLGQATGVVAGVAAAPCSASLDCDIALPKPIMFVPTFDAVSLGTVHTCALRAGAINCWGDNARSELGSGGGTSRPRLVSAPGALPWTGLIATGELSQCARLGPAAQVYCWGDTLTGNVQMPTRETVLDGVKQFVAIGPNTACYLDATSTLFCEGDNSTGEYGNDQIPTSPTPISVGRTYTAIASTLFDAHTCGIRTDTQVECWGRNSKGQVGQTDAATQLVDPVVSPYVVPGLASCTAVSTSALTSCAICAGEIWCWGFNGFGGVGAGEPTNDPVTVPRQLAHLDGDPWVDLRSGAYHACARSQSGRAFCWGGSTHGGLGSGVGANLPVTVLATPP